MSRVARGLLLSGILCVQATSIQEAHADCRDVAMLLAGLALPGLISNVAFAIHDISSRENPDRGVAIAEVASQTPIALFHAVMLPISLTTLGRNKARQNWCWPVLELSFLLPSVALMAHGSWVLANTSSGDPPQADGQTGALVVPSTSTAALPALSPLLQVRRRRL